MAFCNVCGKELGEGARFCSYCGAATETVNVGTNENVSINNTIVTEETVVVETVQTSTQPVPELVLEPDFEIPKAEAAGDGQAQDSAKGEDAKSDEARGAEGKANHQPPPHGEQKTGSGAGSNNNKTAEDAAMFFEKLGQFVSKLLDTKDSTNEFTKEDIEKGKGMSILSYISILVFIPMFVDKNSRFVRYHVTQGFNIFLLMAAHFCVFRIVGRILSAAVMHLWVVDFVLGLADSLTGLVIAALAIVGIVNVCLGKAREVPVIGAVHLIK